MKKRLVIIGLVMVMLMSLMSCAGKPASGKYRSGSDDETGSVLVLDGNKYTLTMSGVVTDSGTFSMVGSTMKFTADTKNFPNAAELKATYDAETDAITFTNGTVLNRVTEDAGTQS